jgi:hypothetical protein
VILRSVEINEIEKLLFAFLASPANPAAGVSSPVGVN